MTTKRSNTVAQLGTDAVSSNAFDYRTQRGSAGSRRQLSRKVGNALNTQVPEASRASTTPAALPRRGPRSAPGSVSDYVSAQIIKLHHYLQLLAFALITSTILGAFGFASGQQDKPATGAPRITATSVSNEVRALWVVRTTLTSPEKIRTMVEAASNNGFNTLIVQVRGRGDSYYRSNREPRATELNGQPMDFDPLAVTLREANRRGLKVHAWLNTSLLANLDALPTDPRHVYHKHPDWLAVPRPVAAELYRMSPRDPRYRERIVEWSKANRQELEGIYTGPANPRVREHIYKIWMDVLKNYKVDGLHFDYVRLASPDFDYSRTSLENFLKWLKPGLSVVEQRQLKLSLKDNPLAAADAYPKLFADFQREQITMLVAHIYREVKKKKPLVTVSAAVFANDENAYSRRFQDWRRWLSMGILDVVCPMAYSTDTAVFEKQIEIATSSAHASGRGIWAGIGAYRIPAASAVEKINVARRIGSEGVILFSYDFTTRPSELNPATDYLQRVRRGAFEKAAAN
ncbi:MAG: family 10 glycosylhydrolase [Acidobacteriota bacterium]